ncbi:MAG: hypothetical protein H6852_02520 [Geminicoccaceae bacterium]|jgi:hypothetical protein|nr:hypothetical protein [Geminicoccaceae bacterium]MCB9966497.1 hypothetical protein [Geminicoccaceae bacterium]HRY24997.1 hypothetical protein [Geminicoccaceae bacterium]
MPSERNVVIRLSGWARTLVLRETGEPVELVHIEELDDRRRAFVELPSGLRTYVAEAALTSRVARLSEGALTLAGVAIAGALLGYSFNLPQDELTASSNPRPVVVGALEG